MVVRSYKLKEKPCEEKEPDVEMSAGQLIAVACEDAWYPGMYLSLLCLKLKNTHTGT